MVDSVDLRRKYKQTEGDVLVRGTVPTVIESISNILETMQGTRLFNRGFGAGIEALLFEPMTDITASLLMLAIDQALERHEPRAVLILSASEIVADFDNNGYSARLVFRVSGTDEVGEFNTFISSQVR